MKPTTVHRTLTLIVGALVACSAGASEVDCKSSGTLPDQSIFIGYTRASESMLNSFALLAGTRLAPYDGDGLTTGRTLYGLIGATQTEIAKIDPYLEHLGDDHCVYPATLSSTASDSWEIWSTDPALRHKIRRPTPSEASRFRELENECIVQGGPTDGPPPECVRPILIAVSDLDADGEFEYWHSVPYIWDTAFRVAEQRPEGELDTVLTACPGCSD